MLAEKSTLVFGGAASGKSAYAEKLVRVFPGTIFYIATAQALDDEMSEKIAYHRRRRGDSWITIEEPYDLPHVITKYGATGAVLMVDCLTLWLNNIVSIKRDVDNQTKALTAAISSIKGRIVLVSNEIGHGLVPMDGQNRQFRDLHGELNQAVAAAVDQVIFVAAGLPITLKGGPN